MTKLLLPAIALLVLVSCTSPQQRDPVGVIVAGIEPLEGQGLELRMLGISVEMGVQGKRFERRVHPARGIAGQGVTLAAA